MAFLDKFVDVVDFGTQTPGIVAEKADKANDRMIDIAKDLQAALDASGQAAEENLRGNKIGSIGRDAAGWVERNMNVVMIGGAAFFFLILILIFRR